MRKTKQREKKSWFRGFLVFVLVFGMLFGVKEQEIKAGILEYQARIESVTGGNTMTFTCKLNQIVDGQETVY